MNMGFEKTIPSKITEYKIYDVDSQDELEKVAGDVDFPEGFVYDPDFLYMWIRIVSAGEYYGPNNNGDFFPEEELVAFWESFREAHAFNNHKNKHAEDAMGVIVTVRWNPVMKCVELLKGIDKKRAPELARGYLKGYMTDVSMGCKVPYTVCSVCGNKAARRSQFCDHVNKYRLQILGNGERVYEINYKPRFHDSSTVLTGAERVAKAFYIFTEPPANVAVSPFKKTAGLDGTIRFVRQNQQDMEKVAHFQENMHSLLKPEVTEKVASSSPMMRKIAELEKELTGKLLNVMSAPDSKKTPAMKQMLEVIKFLTEKRFDENTIRKIAASVKAIADENNIPKARAFSTLVGVAELMGIEFFPYELHQLLRHLTDAKLNSELNASEVEDDVVYPSAFAKGINRAVSDVGVMKDFEDPSSLLHLYNESALDHVGWNDDPVGFLDQIQEDDHMNFDPPVRLVKVIKKTLTPLMASRSQHPEHLMPRLSVILNGRRSIIGDASAKRDIEMLSNPVTSGDFLGRAAYNIYENMRPGLMMTRFVKEASKIDTELEKTAKKYEPKANIGLAPKNKVKKPGLSTGKLALMAIPTAFAASAFQKNRRENNRFLSDGENFVADHPGIVAGGSVLAGKPLSRAVAKATAKGGSAAKGAAEKITSPFTKMSDDQSFEGLLKIADQLPSGAFNAFEDNKVLEQYMRETNASGEEASAVKMATLLSFGGMEKEAFQIMDHYNIPTQEKGRFLKVAGEYLDGEMSKAAEDFTNNMIMSALGDTNPLARTLPGRVVDAYVFKKLNNLGSQNEVAQPKQPKLDSE